MFSQVIKNKYNFYELKEKPSGEELELYYSKKYYQTSQSSYQKKYSDQEIIYIKNKIEQKYSIILDIFDLKENPCLLDIGSGEG